MPLGGMTPYPNMNQAAPMGGITGGQTLAPGGTFQGLQPRNLPVVQSPLRTTPHINPDGSVGPTVNPQVGGAAVLPSQPITGAARDIGITGTGLGTAISNPGALFRQQFTAQGQDPYAGLADAIIQMLPPDQLGQLIDIVNATAAAAGQIPTMAVDDGTRVNQMLGLSTALQGQNQLPSLGQIFGGLFGMGSSANTPGNENPFYGLLAGGTPEQQAGALLNAVLGMSKVTGISGGQQNALASTLNALAEEYLGGAMTGSNTAFLDYIQRRAPLLARTLGAHV